MYAPVAGFSFSYYPSRLSRFLQRPEGMLMYYFVHSAFFTLKSYYFSRSPHFYSGLWSVKFAFQNSHVPFLYMSNFAPQIAPAFIKLFSKNALCGHLIQKKEF